MANLYSDSFGAGMDAVRRQTAHTRRARMMMAAAGLCAFGLVAVAATLLINLI